MGSQLMGIFLFLTHVCPFQALASKGPRIMVTRFMSLLDCAKYGDSIWHELLLFILYSGVFGEEIRLMRGLFFRGVHVLVALGPLIWYVYVAPA